MLSRLNSRNLIAVGVSASIFKSKFQNVPAFSENEEKIFRRSEVVKHTDAKSGIWTIYGDGVYDITSFVPNHPGGSEKIMMAAGTNVEPFWNLYRQHYNSKVPLEILEQLRIGTLHESDIMDESVHSDDPYNEDPPISPLLRILQDRPINAEPDAKKLGENWITPLEVWFIRNHHPVPHKDATGYPVRFNDAETFEFPKSPIPSITLQDLKTKFKKVEIVSTIQCGGNRRSDMNEVEKTSGNAWNQGAISTAKWGGVRLADLLQAVYGINTKWLFRMINEGKPVPKHVVVTATDGLSASIPLKTALSLFDDVILAYEMNDVPLPDVHGSPLRLVVPGHVGVRNVKWVDSIALSSEEAKGTWQRGIAYKGFAPQLKAVDGVDVESLVSLQEQPVQSSITSHMNHQVIKYGKNTVEGYAYSGGGRKIIRVDVSGDNGKTWHTARITQGNDQELDRAWAWVLWQCDIDIPESVGNQPVLVCKAVDSSYNVQPDNTEGIWNLRGINHNAWHRVPVTLKAIE